MFTLITIWENFTAGYKAEYLDIISFISITCSILIIVTKNPIVSALYLIGLFISISAYLIFIGLNFIGLSYLLVYVGAVSILFLFILMLINVRISELTTNTSNSLPLVIIISFLFFSSLYNIIPNGYTTSYNYIYYMINLAFNNIKDIFSNSNIESDNGVISFVTSSTWDGNLSETSHITSIGNIMFTSFSIWLILTSIILLLAMIGAIVITIKQKDSPYDGIDFPVINLLRKPTNYPPFRAHGIKDFSCLNSK